MKRALKWIGIIIAVLIVIVLVLPFLINVNAFRPRIESELTDALGRKVTVGNLSLSILSGSLAADDIAIADDSSFSSAPFIRAKALNVGVEMVPLILSKTLHVTDLTLSAPQVALLRAPSGRWNFSTLGNASPAKKSGAASAAGPGQSGKPPTANPNDARNPRSEQSIAQNLSVGKLSIKDGQVSIADTG